MDICSGTAYFDRQLFDCYDFEAQEWVPEAFHGQLRTANTTVTPLNRFTRARMLYCTPDSQPTSTVLRVTDSGEVFLVGNAETDVDHASGYRLVANLHKAASVAEIWRLNPGTAGSRGWATNAKVADTFADAELRNIDTDQENTIFNYGMFLLVLPSDAPLQKHDTVVLAGKTYYVLETYLDSGFLSARATIKPDERVNFQYVKTTGQSYNTATQTPTETTVTYHVTGKLTLRNSVQDPNLEAFETDLHVLIAASFIDFTPKVNDVLSYLGQTYRVNDVSRDALLEEWRLKAVTGGR